VSAFSVALRTSTIETTADCDAVDSLMSKVLEGTLRLLSQAFFCCRRPVTAAIPLQSVSLLTVVCERRE